MLLVDLKKIFFTRLKSIYSEGEINSVFSILAAHYLNYSKIDLFINETKKVKHLIVSLFLGALSKLEKNMPVQYVTGETEFYGLKFKVNKYVLIPRPETEELVDWIIKEEKNISESLFNSGKAKTRRLKIMDIGTGSGCIAISLKKNLSNAEVYAMDISKKALNTAKENSIQNNLQINFFQHDILQIGGVVPFPGKKYSIIVSNPPYVTLSDKREMKKNVLDFEPPQALFAPPENPLLFYNSIVNFAGKHLAKGGSLFFEINFRYGKKIKKMLVENGFQKVIIKKDLSGKDRMVKAKKG